MGVFVSAAEGSLDDQLSAAQAAKIDDSPAMADILNRFEGLASSIARTLTSDWSLQQDLTQSARIGVVKAVRNHSVGTLGFPSYAKRYMVGEARRTLMAMTAKNETAIDPIDYELIDAVPRDAAPDTTYEVIDLISVLTPEQQAVATAHYIHGVSVTKIASALGISKPAVSQRLNTIHRVLHGPVAMAVAA